MSCFMGLGVGAIAEAARDAAAGGHASDGLSPSASARTWYPCPTHVPSSGTPPAPAALRAFLYVSAYSFYCTIFICYAHAVVP